MTMLRPASSVNTRGAAPVRGKTRGGLGAAGGAAGLVGACEPAAAGATCAAVVLRGDDCAGDADGAAIAALASPSATAPTTAATMSCGPPHRTGALRTHRP